MEKVGIYVGRFQPFHIGHLHVIRTALTGFGTMDKLILIIGSSDTIDHKNPYSYKVRKDFIWHCLTPEEKSKVIISGLRDSTEEDRKVDPYWWYTQVRTMIQGFCPGAEFYIYGSKKDPATQDYLNKIKTLCGVSGDCFVDPLQSPTEPGLVINASDIRTILKKPIEERTGSGMEFLRKVLPGGLVNLFILTR